MTDTPIAIVTGAARGVGAATARTFSEAGYLPVLLDIDDVGEDVAKETGGRFLRFDVSDPEAWARLEATIAADYGRLDALVNNAGCEGRAPIETLSPEQWRRTIDVNLSGSFYGCQIALRLMPNNPEGVTGAIVNVASIAATLSIPDDPAYTASKGGLVSLTRSIAHYCGRQALPIRCNVVSPGAIRTELLDAYIAGSPDPDATVNALNNLQPIGRLATPENIANLIFYLCTEKADFISGADIIIDGGATSAARV